MGSYGKTQEKSENQCALTSCKHRREKRTWKKQKLGLKKEKKTEKEKRTAHVLNKGEGKVGDFFDNDAKMGDILKENCVLQLTF